MEKNAKKSIEGIAKLQNDGNFNEISDPPSMSSISHRRIMEFKSRKWIEEDIIESLRSSSVRVIGICGMGGVGKTTIVQKIRKRVTEEKLFDEVVMVVVSPQIDMLKIQNEVAELLCLKLDSEIMSIRAHQLHRRLMDIKRKIIIFDDVWESFKLEYIGFPFESGFERCKILLTTRYKDVCKRMEAKKIITMEILTKEEAWTLFKEEVGDCMEDSALVSVGKDVVAECEGLPIAVVMVGKALQNRKKSNWVYLLSQLRISNPVDFLEVLAVYKSLKRSYDYLNLECERYLILLCCLFCEADNIPVEELTWYGKGLGILGDITSIEQTRNRTHAIVAKLKSRFLLMDGHVSDGLFIERNVKMHDVVRDVAIYIGSKEKDGFLKCLNKTSIQSSSDVNCNWLSVDISNEPMNVPLGLRFPKLRLLMLLNSSSKECYSSSKECYDISFEGMEVLNVLSFSKIWIGSLPPTLGLLKNLHTLCLFHCEVENISVVGELAGLEIFRCHGCHELKELPVEIGRLNRLRLLEFYGCGNIQRIPFGIISSLVRLEELKFRGSFSKWETGGERRNAAVTELESLPNLSCLEIEIDDWNLAAQDICLFPKLIRYCIRMVSPDYWIEYRDYEKVMSLNLPGAIGNWIRLLVRNAESLTLRGDGSDNINLAKTENLRYLQFSNSSKVKKLVKAKYCKSGIVFPFLDTLILDGLENLEFICDRTIIINQNVSLCRLKFIEILDCSNLRYLFSVSTARRCLLQLEVLKIQSCLKLEKVFWNEIREDTGADACIEFPKLKTLMLSHLPNLTAFCEGVETVKFPQLLKLRIEELPQLSSFDSEAPCDDTNCFDFLCNQKVEIGCLETLSLFHFGYNIRNIWCLQIPSNLFNNLQELRIFGLKVIRSLMPTSIAKNLVSLKYLDIKGCEKMVRVIEGGDDLKPVVYSKCLFPTLTRPEIWWLHKLTRFWQWKQALELPLLEKVYIQDCPAMETFTLGPSLNTPNIKTLMIDGQQIDDAKNLNDALHYHFTTKSQDTSKRRTRRG